MHQTWQRCLNQIPNVREIKLEDHMSFYVILFTTFMNIVYMPLYVSFSYLCRYLQLYAIGISHMFLVYDYLYIDTKNLEYIWCLRESCHQIIVMLLSYFLGKMYLTYNKNRNNLSTL
jgi:hypothetical protein